MDRALRGNRLTQQRAGRIKREGQDYKRQPPKSKQEERNEAYARLGRSVTGIEGKPHSTQEGQKYAGARFLTRMWYGRGDKYTDFKKKQKEKKKGVPV
jgi:hypothetical protein